MSHSVCIADEDNSVKNGTHDSVAGASSYRSKKHKPQSKPTCPVKFTTRVPSVIVPGHRASPPPSDIGSSYFHDRFRMASSIL